MWRTYADALAPIPEQGGGYPERRYEVKLYGWRIGAGVISTAIHEALSIHGARLSADCPEIIPLECVLFLSTTFLGLSGFRLECTLLIP